MGLDSYLYGKRYFTEETGRNILMNESIGYPVSEVKIVVAYWRKANFIHDWFVREVQGDRDDCREYNVSRTKLGELKELCESVSTDHGKAHKLLPTKRGFFFGETDYDDAYYESLTYTVQAIEKALQLPPHWEFEYHSSW